MFNKTWRDDTLTRIDGTHYDLVIVGGGITGAGVARDAASRGLSVLLLEARDFASGTSSRSSKLVHGGIRYLENLEFGLVHEALTERQLLLQIAPHMVHPLRFTIPIYKKSRVGLLKMELGMILYDILSLFEAPQLHEFHGAKGTQYREPTLLTTELTGSVTYSDAFMEDDRLVVETLRSAQNQGARCLSYTPVTAISENEAGCAVEFTDSVAQTHHRVTARHVVGCVGPWTDIFGKDILRQWKPSLRPTKGVHLVFDRNRLPVNQAVVMAVEARIVFVIPRGQVVIVGTTDTDFKGDPQDVTTDHEDASYLLSVTNRYFPDTNLQKRDIISCYSGVRPLVQDQAASESKTSREHQIFKHSRRITVVAGGKYTTYRAMAEEIVETVLESFDFDSRMSLKAPQTKKPINERVTIEKIDRLMAQSEALAEQHAIPLPDVRFLIGRRGEEALQVFAMMAGLGGSAEERLWQAEARFSINHEMCFRLTDFYWRRTPLFLFRADHGVGYLRSLAQVFANKLGWSPEQTESEIRSVEELIARDTASLR